MTPSVLTDRQMLGVVQRAIAPSMMPSIPRWLIEPYADRNACWGCGLEPSQGDICIPEEIWTEGHGASTIERFTDARLCRWCDELRQAPG